MTGMNHTDVVSIEVADRLKAIGVLGERVSQDRITPAEATQIADSLLVWCWRHLTEGRN